MHAGLRHVTERPASFSASERPLAARKQGMMLVLGKSTSSFENMQSLASQRHLVLCKLLSLRPQHLPSSLSPNKCNNVELSRPPHNLPSSEKPRRDRMMELDAHLSILLQAPINHGEPSAAGTYPLSLRLL